MEQIAETFLNRDSSVPVIQTGRGEQEDKQEKEEGEEKPSVATGMKHRLDAAYTKVKGDEGLPGSSEAKDGGALSLQDRLFAK